MKKNDLSEADKDIVKALLLEIKPDQMFVAGDLADPHGTHKVCLDAVLAAIDEVKDEEWMKNCRVWMYRGAWAEWEMDHIEMAVPISPEELRFKRNAILKHQSQAGHHARRDRFPDNRIRYCAEYQSGPRSERLVY